MGRTSCLVLDFFFSFDTRARDFLEGLDYGTSCRRHYSWYLCGFKNKARGDTILYADRLLDLDSVYDCRAFILRTGQSDRRRSRYLDGDVPARSKERD